MTRYAHGDGLKTEEYKQYRLAQAGQTKVCVDDFVWSVLRESDGKTFQEIYAALNKDRCVPEILLDCTLQLLVSAGLLKNGTGRESRKPGESPAEEDAETPLVSAVILNYNGRRHLPELIESLRRQTYPKLEVIVVDNASTDDSIEFIRREYPEVQVIESSMNSGFSKGNNLGIKAAAGKFIFILNNDTKVDPGCVSALVKASRGRGQVGAVAARMMLYDNPGFINSLGNSVSPYTWGSDNYMGYLDVGQFRRPMSVFSACFGAALISRTALTEVGLLDPGYKFYYEDTDWCYRARLRGFRIIAAPDAIVYHKFSASTKDQPDYVKLRLAAGSRLRFAIKNLEFRNMLWFGRNYVLREDLRSVARYVVTGQWRGAVLYSLSYARLILTSPRLLILRLVTRFGRNKSATDERLLRAIYHAPEPQMEDSYPLIDLKNIRTYYSHTGIV